VSAEIFNNILRQYGESVSKVAKLQEPPKEKSLLDIVHEIEAVLKRMKEDSR
jgi:hypothetical protein